MALAAGERLGPYEVVSRVGAGGMGEVYRARDSRLGRDVAIKILATQLVSGPDLRDRFEREARTISQLSHAHICALYDIGRQDDVDYLVMEFLEGETLEHRLSRGALPAEQVIKIAIQIADALDKAHRQGIVHRDIKPGNVMLTKAGVKLMDFGLAKLRNEPAPAVTALAEMATAATKKLTAEGMIVGTFQYMAPEQLEGSEADSRSDIFALGEVIYEMASGRPAFSGKTKASLIAAILSSDPKPVSEVAPMTPPALDRVIRTCLAKDPEDRWQTAHDLKLQLQWLLEAGSQAGVPAPVIARRKHREGLAWAAAFVSLLVALLAFGLAYREHSRIFPIAVRSSIEPPEKMAFAFTGDGGGPPAISPDGTRIVFAATDQQGLQRLWLRSLNSLNPQIIAGTDNATFPFWSYDGRSIGFFAEGSLKVSDLSGAPPMVLCPAPFGRGGTWNRDNIIVFTPTFRAGLMSIPAAGGTPKMLIDIADSPFSSLRWPQFTDDKHFLYLAVQHEKGAESSLFLSSMDDPKPKLIMKTTAGARFGSGRLLFMRSNTLVSQPFDPSSGKLSGEPMPVADEVLWDAGIWRAVFDVSANGVLIAERGTVATATRLAWTDRSGKQLSAIDVPTGFQTQSLSRDGRYLAVQGNPASDLWKYDLERGVHMRLTFDPGVHQFPVFSPDGRWLAYGADKDGHFDLFRKPADGTGSPEPLVVTPKTKILTDWSLDGKYLLYSQNGDTQRASDIWALPLTGDQKPFVVVQSGFSNVPAFFSPDAKWIVYQSDESGRPEIYVTNFPTPRGKWQVSTRGGLGPQWSRDGKEIFFIAANDNRATAVPVTTKGDQFLIGEAKPLFRLSGSAQIYAWFIASPKGDKFLAPASIGDTQPPLTLVTNWTAGVKK